MKGFFIDVQGTLIDDKNFLPLEGSIEFLDYLNSKKIPFVLITNNTKRPSSEFKNYLRKLGFNFENYIDPLIVFEKMKNYDSLAAYGSEKFIRTLQKSGFVLDYKNPKAVVLAIKLYSNEELSEIIEFLLNGAKLIGMHQTSLYSKNDKRYPGLGAILEMLKYATGKKYITLGKPSIDFFDKAKSYLGLNYDKITIVSDDLKGDLLPAKSLGMQTVLVLSGKIKNEKEITEKPDFVFRNISYLLTQIKAES